MNCQTNPVAEETTMTNVARPISRQLPVWVMVAMLAACGGGGGEPMAVAQATASGASAAQGARLAALPSQPLAVAEAQSLAFMREEEQLAHDVYAQSARLWPTQPLFGNIADSEATHTAAVKSLLDRYALPDPLAGLPGGNFSTDEFQALYDDLVAVSGRSLIDALKVGLQIEELDIRDIETQKQGIDNDDILRVYDQLLRGSRNHLRAYWQALLQQGGSYVPQYLSQEQFDAILAAPREAGR
jgi:hypothetical protein